MHMLDQRLWDVMTMCSGGNSLRWFSRNDDRLENRGNLAQFVTEAGVDYPKSFRRLRSLNAAVEPESYGARMLREVLTYTDAGKLRPVIATLRNDYKLLVARLQRFRNSSIHGGAIRSGTLSTVTDFARAQALTALSWQIDATVDDRDTATSMYQKRDRARARVDAAMAKGLHNL